VLDKDMNLLPELTLGDIDRLTADGTISGGMIPKLESCASVVRGGVDGVVITDGRVPHCVLLELLTPHGVGTRISERQAKRS
jgi:acetylglutamate kinase